jgi:hypothetical protein
LLYTLTNGATGRTWLVLETGASTPQSQKEFRITHAKYLLGNGWPDAVINGARKVGHTTLEFSSYDLQLNELVSKIGLKFQPSWLGSTGWISSGPTHFVHDFCSFASDMDTKINHMFVCVCPFSSGREVFFDRKDPSMH